MSKRYRDETFGSLSEALMQRVNERSAASPSAAATADITADIKTLVGTLQESLHGVEAQRIGQPILASHVKQLTKRAEGLPNAAAIATAYAYLRSVTVYEDGADERYEIKSNCSDNFLSVRVRIGKNCRFLFTSQVNRDIALLRSWWIAFTDLRGDDNDATGGFPSSSRLKDRTMSLGRLPHGATYFHVDGQQAPQSLKRKYFDNDYKDTEEEEKSGGGMWRRIRRLITADNGTDEKTDETSPIDALSNEQLAAFIIAALDARVFAEDCRYFEEYDVDPDGDANSESGAEEEREEEEGANASATRKKDDLIVTPPLRDGKYGLCDLPLPRLGFW